MPINLKSNFKFNRRKWVVLAVFATTVSMLYQNCAPQNKKARVISQIPLPFSEQKVQINKSLFKAVKMDEVSSAQEKPIARAPEKLKISILIDNKCALNNCRTGDEEKILTCGLVNEHLSEGLKEFVQYYDYELPQAMSQKEVEEFISQNTVDTECIVGLSETHRYKHSASFNDSFVSNQTATLNAMNYGVAIDQLNPQDLGNVRVGVIDTGVEDHSDATAVLKRTDSRSADSKADPTCPSSFQDYYGHGSFVAGIISAKQNNGAGVVGLAPNAQIYSYMIGRCSDSSASTTEMANAVFGAVADGVEVINLSYGGNTGDDVSFRQALAIALNSRTIIVMAAGNNDADVLASGRVFYPAAYASNYPGMITVAATDNLGAKAKFSNYSSTAVKIAAPGVDIWSLSSTLCKFCTGSVSDSSGNYVKGSGTSFSTPIVTAEVAWIIGFMKRYNITVGNTGEFAEFVENYVTNFGADPKANLLSVVKNGKFINFKTLATALLRLKPDATVTPSSNISYTYVYDQSGATPVVRVTMTWNLPSVHPGARLGIYDGTCEGTSNACLIQDVALPGTSGSYTFNLSRDQLVPMLASKKDPTYSLNLNLAIHYPIPRAYDMNGKPIAYANNHGLDAVRTINVRDLDGSNSSSELFGEITNIRSDMQYYYVQGWACFTGSNKTVNVGIVDSDGNAVPANYSYNYPWMVPHSGPLDGGFSKYSNLATKPYSSPFMAYDITIIRREAKTSYPAGLEANPQNVLKCNTVTASHGFELIIPIWQIASTNLSLKNFNVVGTYVNTKDSNRQLSAVLKDRNGRATYSFPDVNFQTSVTSTFNVDRTGADDFSIVGSICSNSPSPVEVEVSAGYGDYSAAVFGDNTFQAAGSAGGRPEIGPGTGPGFVADPNYDVANSVQSKVVTVEIEGRPNAFFTDAESYISAIETGNLITSTQSNFAFKYELSEELDFEEKKRVDWYIKWAGETSPNTFDTRAYIPVTRKFKYSFSTAALDLATVRRLDAAEQKISQAINAQVKKSDLRQVKTNSAVNFYNPTTSHLEVEGPQFQNLREKNKVDRSLASFGATAKPHWDYYDMGEMFSIDLIGYKFNIQNPVGAYLKETYRVDTILREAKKYEVPLSTYSVDLAHEQMYLNKTTGTAACGALFQHYVNPLKIAERVSNMAGVNHFVQGFWVNGFYPKGAQSIESKDIIMKRLPLNLRFFQDGKMILHINSDYGSNFTEVRYPFQAVGY